MFGPLHIHIFSLGLSLTDFVSSVLGKEKMCSIKGKFTKYLLLHDNNFVLSAEFADVILATLHRKTSNKEYCRFCDKMAFDLTRLDVDVHTLPWKSILPGHFKAGAQPHNSQLAI